LKVLHIIDSAGLYGAEVMLLNLIAEQLRLGLAPAVASIGAKGSPEKPLEQAAARRGFEVAKFRMAPGPNLAGALAVLRHARRNRFDLLHSHGYKGNILFGFLPQRLRRMPMVSTLHGWTATEGLSKMRAYEWLDARSLRHIDAVVLVSQAMRSHPRLRNLNGTNFSVVNNGIPFATESAAAAVPAPFDGVEKQVIDFCAQGFTVGAIGRLSAEKGFGRLIEALSLLKSQGRDVRLVIVGDGELRSELEGQVRSLGLGGRVMLPGYLQDARRLLTHFKVFVIPSFTEGLPITLLEAMQAVTPVVASAVGGIPEALGHGRDGILVTPGHPGEIAAGIIRCMADPAFARGAASRAQDRVRSEYDSRGMAAAYLRIYRQAAARNGRQRAADFQGP
jgi:glycosyltransferase involved in cell wall biosynthesis